MDGACFIHARRSTRTKHPGEIALAFLACKPGSWQSRNNPGEIAWYRCVPYHGVYARNLPSTAILTLAWASSRNVTIDKNVRDWRRVHLKERRDEVDQCPDLARVHGLSIVLAVPESGSIGLETPKTDVL